MAEETAGPTFDIQKSFDAQRQVWTITLFAPPGERLCSVEASPFGVIVNGAPGSFFPIGQFSNGSARETEERIGGLQTPLPGVVAVHRDIGDGSFVLAREFYADITTGDGGSACPHCGNAEGNADRLRCFICNREM